jgi:hypothetical protein
VQASTAFLPYLAQAAREARLDVGLKYTHISHLVLKRGGKAGVSESTLARFEHAEHWPEDPDAMINAYCQAIDCHPYELWARALRCWQENANLKPQRPPRG